MTVTEWPALILYNQCHGREEHVAHGFQSASHLDLWLALQALGPSGVDCTQKTLFRCGEPCRGLYMVEEGCVKLRLSLPEGGGPEFETVGAGAVIGLAETMTGGDHKLTAEAMDGARISYIDRVSFMEGLQKNHELSLRIVHLLSEDLHKLYQRFLSMLPTSHPSGDQGPGSVH